MQPVSQARRPIQSCHLTGSPPRTSSSGLAPGRYRPDDQILAFLGQAGTRAGPVHGRSVVLVSHDLAVQNCSVLAWSCDIVRECRRTFMKEDHPRLLLALGLLLAWGCGATDDSDGPTCNMSASQYDNSCTVDSDCVGVPEGDPCAGNCLSVCPTVALNARVASQYLTDLQVVSAGRDENLVCNCPCIAAQPYCCLGICYNGCGDCSTPN